MAEEAPETRAGEPRPSSEPARQTEGLYTGAVPVVRLNGSAGPQKALRALPADLLEALVVLTTLDEKLATLQRALGGDQELVNVDRLHDDVAGAELQAGDRRLHVGGAGQHDHGDVVVHRPHLLEELDTRDARHLEVGHHEWRTARLERLHALAAVVREQTLVSGGDEDLVKDFACLMVVLDDQDLALRHRRHGIIVQSRGLHALPADLLEAFVVLTTLDEELATLQRTLDDDQELVHVDGLPKVGVRAELQAHDMVLHVHPADDDDGRVRVLLADLLEELDARAGHALTATHHRHIELGDDQRRSRPTEHLEPFAPVAGQQARVASSEEELAEEEADVGVVLDDQDLALRHVSPPPTGRSRRGAYPPKVSLCKVRWTLRKALDSGKRLVHPAPMESAR